MYIDLVNTITEPDAWGAITDFFTKREASAVSCISIPLRSNTQESNRAVQVSNWWDRIEQESLRKSLDYRFMFATDISNCYPSIYTHAFEWALHQDGRAGVKIKRSSGKETKNLGSEIDFRLRQMNHDQTIGIPQGSVLMDFLAEIILGATDLELTEKINDTLGNNSNFSIIRYRDDYRIFTNEYQVGHSIMKMLNTVLYNWNFKMNTAKTSETSDIITSAIKPEKIEEIYTAPIRHSYQKAAMRIYTLSKKYPNSGLVAKNLTDYFDQIYNSRKKIKAIDHEVIIAIMAMVAYYSPKYMPQVAGIIDTLFEAADEKLERKKIITKIVNKFHNLPNTEMIDLWLQRISSKDDIRDYTFSSAITLVALGKLDNSNLWNSNWLELSTRETINKVSITELPEQLENDTFSPHVDRKEFELYRHTYQ